MSSRALRKLQQQKGADDLILTGKLAEEDEMNEDNDHIGTNEQAKSKKKKKKKANLREQQGNLFDLLGGEESLENLNISNNDDSEAVEETKHNEAGKENKPEQVQSGAKKKKKKAKKKNIPTDEYLEGEDEVDKSIREVNQLLGVQASKQLPGEHEESSIAVFRDTKSFLAVEHKHLNPDEEMKKRFGANVVRPERRRNPHEKRYKRPTWLVVPKEQWGRIGKTGIDMKLVEKQGSATTFCIEHLPSYQKVQFQFLDAVESLNHNNIMALLNVHPYHVDSLLQMSEICKMNEDFQMAAELIERSLYVIESNFHTMFNVSQGNCRLDFNRAENRPFFLALFRHIHYISQRACYRTALEFCKVLLGLDPKEDPLCVLLMIDYYALKAEQYDYLIRMYNELEITRNISMLPNFSYSVALAYFHKGDQENANKMLDTALLQFPSTVTALMDKCGIVLDSHITNHKYFDPVTYLKQSPSLNQLVTLFVQRNFSVWKEPEVLNWFTERCKHVLDTLSENSSIVQDYKERRETRFKSSPRNILRHIVISDYKEVMALLPLEVRHQPIRMHDPLPPPDSTVGYERPERVNRGQHHNDGLFSLFFRSLMPSFGQERPNSEQEDVVRQFENEARAVEQAGAAAAEVGNPLAGGAQQLMNAMRELLDTMTYRGDLEPRPEDEDGGNNIEDAEWEDHVDG